MMSYESPVKLNSPYQLGIGPRFFPYYHLGTLMEDGLATIVNHRKVYAYTEYTVEAVRQLHALSTLVPTAHISMLFKTADLSSVIEHINLIDSFSFTLIPDVPIYSVYAKLYDYFMANQSSVVPITWFPKLVLGRQQALTKLLIDDEPVDVGSCSPDCPLSQRNCTKQLLFPEVYHPYSRIPVSRYLEHFCKIHLVFSDRIARDIMSSVDTVNVFEEAVTAARVPIPQWSEPHGLFA